MDDDRIFLLLTCVNFAQIARLARYRETGSQATDKSPILSCDVTTRILPANRAENSRPRAKLEWKYNWNPF